MEKSEERVLCHKVLNNKCNIAACWVWRFFFWVGIKGNDLVKKELEDRLCLGT